jgi:preprotein translocase subunit SecG
MLLYYSVVTLHVIVCVILVLVVLLQSGRGADLAGAFGGGATQTAFGSRGPASFLSKMTTIAAIIFMVTSIGLSKITTTTTKKESKSILETNKQQTEPAQKKASSTRPPVAAPTREQIKKKIEELEAAKAAGRGSSSPGKAAEQTSKPAESKPAK